MKQSEYRFSFEEYESVDELPEEDRALLVSAREATVHAYAPYSRFHVAAVARMANNALIFGTNQENASFPVGMCAERVLLATASSQHPNVAILTIAISYDNRNGGNSHHPVAPCGICRQTLQEFETRTDSKVRLILGGMEGKVFVIPSAASLLPLAFTGDELV